MAKETKTPGAAPANAVATYDWSQAPTTGFEQVGKEDLGIPFLTIVQKGSAEIDKTHKEYQLKKIAGVEVGDVVNTISRKIVHKQGQSPLRFITCHYQRLFPEWIPQDKGGGFVRMHSDPNILSECRRNEKGEDVLRNGNTIVTTAYFYGLVLIDNERQPCIISMTSTQLKKARAWLNVATNIKLDGPRGKYTPPFFSHEYLITTVPEHNSKGSWMGWHVDLGPQVGDPVLIAEAIDYSKKARAGTQAALPPASGETEAVPFA